MRDPRLEELAESARNRGLKLVRSRVRTPSKRRFGKVGLTDANGKPMFGMDTKGPAATPEAVEDYLRGLDARDWGASLNAREPVARRKPASPGTEPRARAAPKPRPTPQPKVREARPSDAARLVELIRELGHEIDEKIVRSNLTTLKKIGETPLIAELGRDVAGLVGVHRMVTVHRPAPVGRMPVLVVAKAAQGHGIGRMLVDAAEQWCRDKGCGLIEVTSNDRRAEAHAFYRHMGYERTSIRFMKKLQGAL